MSIKIDAVLTRRPGHSTIPNLPDSVVFVMLQLGGILDTDEQARFARRASEWKVHVSAYKDALQIFVDSPKDRILLASELLRRRQAVVLIEAQLALRPEPDQMVCEVLDPRHGENGSPAHYRRLIERAEALLAKSPLHAATQIQPLKWCVVDDYGTGTTQLWPASA